MTTEDTEDTEDRIASVSSVVHLLLVLHVRRHELYLDREDARHGIGPQVVDV
jgi:hypothetical protein